jgi:hypothetical protein
MVLVDALAQQKALALPPPGYGFVGTPSAAGWRDEVRADRDGLGSDVGDGVGFIVRYRRAPGHS